MLMTGLRKRRSLPALAIALVVLAAVSGSCKKNSTGPETLTASVTFSNSCGADMDVFMDGTLQFTVANGQSETITDVLAGSHSFEVRKSDTAGVLYSDTFTVTGGAAYSVTVQGAATISVTNQYGQLLRIFQNNVYIGDIGDGLTQTISRVKFNTYTMEAKLKNEDTVVASTTIVVTDVQDYPWAITP
jgi:uncharacterized spore protein YtfJ